MINPTIPAGRTKLNNLTSSLKELNALVDDFKSELPRINDAQLGPRATSLVTIVKSVVAAHIDAPRPTIADDLAGLMGAVRAFRLPNQDAELGKTPTLDSLRTFRGLLISGLTDGIEASADIGLYPQNSPLPETNSVEVPRAEHEGLLHGISRRLDSVIESLDALEAANPAIEFPQQTGLVRFYVDSMRVEANVAALQIKVGLHAIDFASLTRAVELMLELTEDFSQTARAWAARVTNEVVQLAKDVRKRLRKVALGVKNAATWIVRTSKFNDINENRNALEKTSEILDEADRIADFPPSFENDSSSFSTYVPFLRRYAYALAGSAKIADDYVTATLEAAVANKRIVERQVPRRLALYALFTKVYNEAAPQNREQMKDAHALSRKFDRLSSLPLQAFLLTALEGFSLPDAELILGVHELTALLDLAGQQLAKIISTDVLIVEDEPFISMDLEGLAENLGLRVAGVARTHSEAVTMAKETKPGALIVDIQLADGSSGLEAVDEILSFMSVPVVFITAYPERFLMGKRPEPAFLIAKPFQPQTVSAVLAMAIFFERNARPG